MKNITVTGVSGYIGTKLLQYLDNDKNVEKIVGIDIREPKEKSAKLKFYEWDVREPFGKLLRENEADTVVHLAFVLRPNRKAETTRQIDVEGMANLVKACREARIGHVIYLSSHTVYGAHKDNPIPLTEDSPLRPLTGFQYSRDKEEAESILRNFTASESSTTVTVLRSCPVIGPSAVGTAPTIMFQPFVMVGVAGGDPPMQFVHEDDLTNIIGLLISQKKGGIYDVAGEGTLKYSEIARLLNKKLIKLPAGLLKAFISFSWATHLQSASPASGLDFIRYPLVVSTEKLKRETGYKFQYSSREALDSLVEAYKKETKQTQVS